MKINYTMFGTGLTGGVRVLLEIVNGLVERDGWWAMTYEQGVKSVVNEHKDNKIC